MNDITKFANQYNNICSELNCGKLFFFQAVKMLLEANQILIVALVRGLCEIIAEQQKLLSQCTFCPYCGTKMHVHKVTQPRFYFPCGIFYLFHYKIRCRSCHFNHSLLKRWIPQGLGEMITPLVGEKLIWLSTLMPYKDVQFFISEFWGLNVSVTGIQKYIARAGKQIIPQTNLLKGNVLEASWDKVYVYVDGVMVFIGNRWREVKVAVIECHKNGKVTYFYHAELTKWKLFMVNLHSILARLGCNNARIRIIISDAGRGITHNLSIFKGYQYLVDYYHASEHLAKFLNLCRFSEKKIARLYKELTSLLIKSKTKELVELMLSLCGKKVTKILQREINYFIKHAPNMNYAKHRQHKWHIGSGKIESACRWLIQQRFKLSGMRWKPDGFRRILGLRLAFYNKSLFPAIRAMNGG